jgi:hypothetical protein
MNYLSQNGFNKVLEQWANVDPNIKSYGWGQLYDNNGNAKAAQLYPAMWVNPVNSTYAGNIINRTYQILFYDIPFQEEGGTTNQNSIISDMEEIAFRFVRFIKANADDADVFNILDAPVISPFTDRFLDDVAGVIIDVTIEFNGQSSDCMDPAYIFNIKYNVI